MPSVVITGVSSGIGLSTARLLLSRGFQVFGSVRKQEDAARLSSELGSGFTPLIFDVTDQVAIAAAAAQVKSALGGELLAGLVNNAGIAVTGALMEVKPEAFKSQMEVNLLGPLLAVQAFGPLLGARRTSQAKPGRVINIGSVVGKLSLPFMGPYGISKHGIEAFSDVLRRELMLYGVDVILVAPGSVKTPIWGKFTPPDPSLKDSDYAAPAKRFETFAKNRASNGLEAEAVAQVILEALTAPFPKARYAVVRNKFRGFILPQWLPKRHVDKQFAKGLGLGRLWES